MPLAVDFRETIRERAQKDAAFRHGLLQKAVELMLAGDVRTGQKIIRNYINAMASGNLPSGFIRQKRA